MGEGRVRGEGASDGWSEARRVRHGGRVMLGGNVGSSCRFGMEVCGVVGRGLLIWLWADGWSVPELAPRGIGRRESGRARPFEATTAKVLDFKGIQNRRQVFHIKLGVQNSTNSCLDLCSVAK
jgi:hypothetical protein